MQANISKQNYFEEATVVPTGQPISQPISVPQMDMYPQEDVQQGMVSLPDMSMQPERAMQPQIGTQPGLQSNKRIQPVIQYNVGMQHVASIQPAYMVQPRINANNQLYMVQQQCVPMQVQQQQIFQIQNRQNIGSNTFDEVPLYVNGGVTGRKKIIILYQSEILQKYATDMISNCGFKLQGVKLEYKINVFCTKQSLEINEKIVQVLQNQNPETNLETIKKSKIVKCAEGLLPQITNGIKWLGIELFIFTALSWILVLYKSKVFCEIEEYEKILNQERDQIEQEGLYSNDQPEQVNSSTKTIDNVMTFAVSQAIIFTLNTIIILFSGSFLNNKLIGILTWSHLAIMVLLYFQFGMGLTLSFIGDQDATFFVINIISLLLFQIVCVVLPIQSIKQKRIINRLLVIIGQIIPQKLN